jgi:hypothetical protein
VEPADLERLGGTCAPGACAHPTAAPAKTNYKTYGHIYMNEQIQEHKTLDILLIYYHYSSLSEGSISLRQAVVDQKSISPKPPRKLPLASAGFKLDVHREYRLYRM